MDPYASPTHPESAIADPANGSTTRALAGPFVGAWLAKQVPGATPELPLRLRARAILVLCDDALNAFGDLTVDAIIARVMALVARRYPILATQSTFVRRIAQIEACASGRMPTIHRISCPYLVSCSRHRCPIWAD